MVRRDEAEYLQEFYTVFCEWADDYHHHKEIMGHAILLVLLGLTAAVLNFGWPPAQVTNDIQCWLVSAATVLTAISLHMGICAQIFNKKVAAMSHEVAMDVLRHLPEVNRRTTKRLRSVDCSTPTVGYWRKLKDTVAEGAAKYFWPIWAREMVKRDVRQRMLPGPLPHEALERAADSKRRTPTYDILLVVMSAGAVAAILCWLSMPLSGRSPTPPPLHHQPMPRLPQRPPLLGVVPFLMLRLRRRLDLAHHDPRPPDQGFGVFGPEVEGFQDASLTPAFAILALESPQRAVGVRPASSATP